MVDDMPNNRPASSVAARWRAVALSAVATILVVVAVSLEYYNKGPRDSLSVFTGILVNFVSALLGFLFAAHFMRSRPWAADADDAAGKGNSDIAAMLEPIRAGVKAIEQSLSLRPADAEQTDQRKILGEIGKLAAGIQDQTRHRVLEQIPWASLLAGASEVDFVVQGWDRWVDDHESEIKDLFKRGGRFRLYIYDPSSERNSYARALMAERLGKTPNDVTVEISGTTSRLLAIRDELLPEDKFREPLKIFHTTKFNWYFAARFQGRKFASGGGGRDVIVFSIYSHTRQKVAKMPAIMLYPDENEEMARWFQNELNHLAESKLG